MANSVNPDHIAPLGSLCPVFTLFDQAHLSEDRVNAVSKGGIIIEPRHEISRPISA